MDRGLGRLVAVLRCCTAAPSRHALRHGGGGLEKECRRGCLGSPASTLYRLDLGLRPIRRSELDQLSYGHVRPPTVGRGPGADQIRSGGIRSRRCDLRITNRATYGRVGRHRLLYFSVACGTSAVRSGRFAALGATLTWRNAFSGAWSRVGASGPVVRRADFRVDQIELPLITADGLKQYQPLTIRLFQLRKYSSESSDDRRDRARGRGYAGARLLKTHVVKAVFLDQLAFLLPVQLVDICGNQDFVPPPGQVWKKSKILLALPADRMNVINLMPRQQVDEWAESRLRHLLIQQDFHAQSHRYTVVVVAHILIKRHGTGNTNGGNRRVEVSYVLSVESVGCKASDGVVWDPGVLDDGESVERAGMDLYPTLRATQRHNCGACPAPKLTEHVPHRDQQPLTWVLKEIYALISSRPYDRASVSNQPIVRKVFHVNERLKVGHRLSDLLKREISSECGKGTNCDEVPEAISNWTYWMSLGNEKGDGTRAPVAELVNCHATKRRCQRVRVRHETSSTLHCRAPHGNRTLRGTYLYERVACPRLHEISRRPVCHRPAHRGAGRRRAATTCVRRAVTTQACGPGAGLLGLPGSVAGGTARNRSPHVARCGGRRRWKRTPGRSGCRSGYPRRDGTAGRTYLGVSRSAGTESDDLPWATPGGSARNPAGTATEPGSR